MNEAIGGTVNVVLIAIFMVLISGYMAFNVSYVKAFKVKNKIIDLIEENEGNCDPNKSSDCVSAIHNYMHEIGYHNATGADTKWCTELPHAVNSDCCDQARGYCISEIRVSTAKKVKVDGTERIVGETKSYYRVLTQVEIEIPIINKLMENIRVFQVTGESKTIKIRDY